MTHKLLDAREMSHPEPLERAVDILKGLDHQSCLYMLSRKNPIPLLQIASKNGFNHIAKEIEPNNWHILITPNKDIDLIKEIDV